MQRLPVHVSLLLQQHVEILDWPAVRDLSLSDLKGRREELGRIKWDI